MMRAITVDEEGVALNTSPSYWSEFFKLIYLSFFGFQILHSMNEPFFVYISNGSDSQLFDEYNHAAQTLFSSTRFYHSSSVEFLPSNVSVFSLLPTVVVFKDNSFLVYDHLRGFIFFFFYQRFIELFAIWMDQMFFLTWEFQDLPCVCLLLSNLYFSIKYFQILIWLSGYTVNVGH